MARRNGNTRIAFDRSARAAARNPVEEQRLDPNLDAALVASGRKIADHLDNAFDELARHLEELTIAATPDQADRLLAAVEKHAQRVDKAIYMTPHLMNILREMYATPKARVDMDLAKNRLPNYEPAKGTGGTVDRFRAITGGKSG